MLATAWSDNQHQRLGYQLDQITPGYADFLLLDPAAAPPRGLTGWLVDTLRSAIADGRLAPGGRLPATRMLATDLAVSRGVVVEAYRRLTDEGLVGGRSGGGTTVLARPARPPRPHPRRSPEPAGFPQLTRPRLPVGEGIDLTPGVPDLSAFPRAAWLRAERAVLAEAPPDELGYGDPRGHPWLRSALAPWLARIRGLRVSPDDILVVSGVAQAFALIGVPLVTERIWSLLVGRAVSKCKEDEALSAAADGRNSFHGCEGAVDGGSGDVEEFGEVGDGVVAGGVHVAELGPLFVG